MYSKSLDRFMFCATSPAMSVAAEPTMKAKQYQ